MGSSNTGHTAPEIIVHRAESTQESLGSAEKTPEPATVYQVSEKAQESPSLRQESPKPPNGPRGPQSPAGGSFIQNRITFNLRVIWEGSPDSKLVEDQSVLLHEPESYRTIEQSAEEYANALSAETIGPRELKFSYGNCTIVSSNDTRIRLPLRSQEDWTNIYKTIVEYWTSHTDERLHLCILRHYLACQDRPSEEKSFAELKCLEIDDLMQQTWEKKDYIPHNILETVISDQTIYWIIKEDPPQGGPQDDQDAFIRRVQAEGRILLAMCVHAGLGMECLKKLLDSGCTDSRLPLNEKSLCHHGCRRKFRTLVQTQGGYRAASFVLGEHKTLHLHTVVPLHFCPKAHGKHEFDREVTEVCGNEPQNSINEEGAIKAAAWCGSGAYSNVYCVKMNPNHHSLSQVSNDL